MDGEVIEQTFDVLAREGLLNNVLTTNLKKGSMLSKHRSPQYESIYWIIVHIIVGYHYADFTEFSKVVAHKRAMSVICTK